MKILIIGGNRFFGKKLAIKLLSEGHQLTLLNRGSLDDGLGDQVARIKCDRTQAPALEKSLAKTDWDIVYDQVCFTATEAQNALGVFKGRVGHYIFTSSQSVYAPNKKIDESFFDPCGHTFKKIETKESDYAEAKRQCEATFFQVQDFPVTAVRFPIVLGADDYTGRLLFHIDRVAKGEDIYFPSLNANISMISSNDAATVLRFLADQLPVGPINAAAEKPIRLIDFLAEVEKEVGKQAILSKRPSETNHSPYGIEKDWFMNTRKLNSINCTPTPIKSWLNLEIQSLIRDKSLRAT